MEKLSMDQLQRKTVEDFKHAEKIPLLVILDNVRSMHNVGSVFRTADAFLLEGILLCGLTPQPPHRDIHKTALGATETVHWEHHVNPVDAVKHLCNEGYSIWAAEQTTGSIMLDQFSKELIPKQRQQKLAVIFGNEVSGVSSDLFALCDGSIEIPQSGTKHSLNISVAAGIVLWELTKILKA